MKSLSSSITLVIDIETATVFPTFEQLPQKDRDLWVKKVSGYALGDLPVEQVFDKRAGVCAEFAKVICIGIGYFETGEKDIFVLRSFHQDDELLLLESFNDFIRTTERDRGSIVFAGHNIREFDIPFLCRRMLINGIKIPNCMDFQQKRPWEVHLLDTLQCWKFGDYKNYISLELLAHVLGVVGSKNDMDGSMVGRLYHESDVDKREQNIGRITEYCLQDVLCVTEILHRWGHLSAVRETQKSDTDLVV